MKKIFFISLTTILLMSSEVYSQSNSRIEIAAPSVTETTEEKKPINEVEEFPDIEPKFPCHTFHKYDSTGIIVESKELCGSKGLGKFIWENVQYPEYSLENNEQGRVYTSFVVGEDGTISDILIERGVSEHLNNEAIRVISSMPNWIPGQKDGKNVVSRMRIPIVFTLQ